MRIDPAQFFRSRMLLIALGMCIVLVFTTTALVVILSLPTESGADVPSQYAPIMDPALILTTILVPITFLVILLTSSKRNG